MRKQVYDLTAADLELHPVWEHCLDEEGVPGQDEATVRPYEAGAAPLEYGGLLVVRASFTLKDGSRFPGYLSYTPELPDATYGPLANLQPQIITPQGQVMFWYGVLAPNAEVLAAAYLKLGARAADVFPARFASDVPLAAGPISGELAGFYYLADRKKGWFSRERVVEVVS